MVGVASTTVQRTATSKKPQNKYWYVEDVQFYSMKKMTTTERGTVEIQVYAYRRKDVWNLLRDLSLI